MGGPSRIAAPHAELPAVAAGKHYCSTCDCETVRVALEGGAVGAGFVHKLAATVCLGPAAAGFVVVGENLPRQGAAFTFSEPLCVLGVIAPFFGYGRPQPFVAQLALRTLVNVYERDGFARRERPNRFCAVSLKTFRQAAGNGLADVFFLAGHMGGTYVAKVGRVVWVKKFDCRSFGVGDNFVT